MEIHGWRDKIGAREVAEVTTLLVAPVLMLVLHGLVGRSTAAQYYFYVYDPSVVSAWTAMVFHASWTHVIGNTVVYTIIVVLLYLVYHRWERRRTMWMLFAFILVSSPVVINYVDVWVFREYLAIAPHGMNSKGFSGVAAAYFGALLGTVWVFANDTIEPGAGWVVVYSVFLIDSIVFATIYAESAQTIVLLVGVSIVWFVWATYWVRENMLGGSLQFTTVRSLIREDYDVYLVVFVVSVEIAGFIGLYPNNVVQDGMFVNILAHSTGLLWGFSATLVFFGVLLLRDVIPTMLLGKPH